MRAVCRMTVYLAGRLAECMEQKRAAHRVDCEVGTCVPSTRVVHSLRDWAVPMGGPRSAALRASDHTTLEYSARLSWIDLGILPNMWFMSEETSAWSSSSSISFR